MTINCNILLLPKIEITVYFFIYITFISYAIFNIYLVSNELPENAPFGFDKGWEFLGRYRDTLGDEWEHAKSFIYSNYPWYIGHITITELFKFLNFKEFYIIHSIIGFTFLITSYKFLIILTILAEILCFYIVSKFSNKYVIWLNAFIWLAFMNLLKKGIGPYMNLNNDEFLQLILILAWNILKCLSYSLNQCNLKLQQKQNNIDNQNGAVEKELKLHYNWKTYCGYIFYYPTLIFGPCMIFDRYINIQCDELEIRIKKLLKNIMKTIFWALFYNFALHYFYIHYLSYDIEKVKSLNFWAFYGYGYLMGQFFHLQYIISYGFSNALAQFDGINTPNQPKCIARVHLYSDMWKYFDQGLYEFLFRYIYMASCNKTSSLLRKFAASLLTFAFIYVWHGLMKFILIWTILNFLCLIFEKILYHYLIVHTTLITDNSNINFNHNNSNNKRYLYLRFSALIGSQLFILAAFSNFYFFANIDIGNYFFQRTYTNGLYNYIIVTVWCYCIFQCSEFISQYEKNKNQQIKISNFCNSINKKN